MEKIVYKASAGTGKTYRLSLEYISKLIKGINFKNIVVMTFTKKATAEIKERIYDFLYQIAFEVENGFELEKNLKEIYKIENINKQKLREIYFEIIKNKEEMRVYTIDSFTNQIFKNAIAPSFNIYNFETLDKESDEFYEKILIKILNNNEYFEKFKFIFDIKEDKKNIDEYVEIIKQIVDNQKNLILFNNKKENKKEQNCKNYRYEVVENIEDIFSKIKEFAEEKKNEKKGKKANEEEDVSAYFEKNFKNIFNEFNKIDNSNLKENDKKDNIENSVKNLDKKVEILLNNWQKLIEIEKVYNGTKIQSKSKKNSNKGEEINVEIRQKLEEEKEKFIKNLSKFIFYEEVLPLDKKIKNISNLIFEIILKEKLSLKKFTHDDITIFTYKFIFDDKLKFIENGKVTQNFLELIGGNIDTIMIDEFQDTSVLQWKILKLLINSANNIICVGDEKQSIYNWRGGEKELFENLESLIDGKIESLNKSYRSYSEIIVNINKIFNGYDEKWNYENVEYRDDKEYQNGYFSYFITQKGSKDKYEKSYEEMIRDIKNNKIKNLGESCIICRTNSHLTEITKRLNEEKILYTITSNDSILEHRAIKPLYKLMKYFVFDNFIYLLEFMRSDLIGCLNSHVKYLTENLEEIDKYLKYLNFDKNQTFEEYIENVENNEIKKSLLQYKEINNLERNNLVFSEILFKIKQLKNLSRNLNSKQIKENFSKRLIESFEVINFYNTNNDIKNIFNFFNILKQYNNLFEFIKFVEDEKDKIKQVSSTNNEAINLMTIHKSKGLEFDTVFYYKRFNSKSDNKNNIKIYFNYDKKFEKIEKFLITFSKHSKILSYIEEYEDLVKNKEFKEKMEEINADYVALTRAKKNLLLYFEGNKTDKDGIKDSLVERLLNIYKDKNESKEILIDKDGRIIEAEDSEEVNEENKGNKVILHSLEIGNVAEKTNEIKNFIDNEYDEIDEIMPYFSDNILVEKKANYGINIDKEYKRKKGLAIHYYLEHILNDIENDKIIAKSSLLNRYGNLIGKEILSDIIEKMDKFIDNNKEIYNKKYKVYTEFEIYTIDESGNSKKNIIDRINIDEEKKEIYIYDYKTGYEPLENKKYEEQINNYKEILNEKTNGEYEIYCEILEI